MHLDKASAEAKHSRVYLKLILIALFMLLFLFTSANFDVSVIFLCHWLYEIHVSLRFKFRLLCYCVAVLH